MEIGVITNPNSRKNQSKSNRVEVLQSIVGDYGQVHQTSSPEAAKPILRDFLRQRAKYWVADGGDGTLHWMLRIGEEVLKEQEFASQGLGIPLTLPTNGGTIDFVTHNVGIKGEAEGILTTLRQSLERGTEIQEVEVDTMSVDGIEVTPEGDKPFHTLGFAAAAGGVGQRFFAKLFESGERTPSVIVSILAKLVLSYPVAMSPLRKIPGMPPMLRNYAQELFKPTMARITLDGEALPRTDCTGINVASMSINLGGVLRFFSGAEVPGQLDAIVGSPTPLRMISNIPRAHLGMKMVGKNLFDGPCREMIIEAVGPELLGPVIDGEYYPNVRKMTFGLGPRIRIPKVVSTTRHALLS